MVLPGRLMCGLTVTGSAQFLNGFTPGDNADRSARRVFKMSIQRNPQRLIQSSQQITRRNRSLADFAATSFTGTDHRSAFQPAATEQHRETVGPVIAARVAV